MRWGFTIFISTRLNLFEIKLRQDKLNFWAIVKDLTFPSLIRPNL